MLQGRWLRLCKTYLKRRAQRFMNVRNNMNDFEKLLTTTARILGELEIPYVVTGGAAVVFWGTPRFTADIDIVVELQESSIPQLAKRLREAFGRTAYIDEEMMQEELQRGGEFNVIHPDSGLKIDFFIRPLEDAFEKEKFFRAVTKEVAGEPVRLIAPEDLILTKLRWGKESMSEKQFADAQSVVATQDKKLDQEYLEKWAQRLDVTDLLAQVLTKDRES